MMLLKKCDKDMLKYCRVNLIMFTNLQVLMRVITKRLIDKINKYQMLEYTCFRKGYSITDHLVTVQSTL